MSWECAGFAREHATLVDQVQFLARILSTKAVGSAVPTRGGKKGSHRGHRVHRERSKDGGVVNTGQIFNG